MTSATQGDRYCSVQEDFDCADGFFGKCLTKIETIKLYINFWRIDVGACKHVIKQVTVMKIVYHYSQNQHVFVSFSPIGTDT